MLAVVVPAGVVVGALLDLLMFLLARYGPHADSWSFRGNGALAVLALVPAALAAGWTMIVAHSRPGARWQVLGAGAFLVGLLLAVVNSAALPVGGVAADQTGGAAALLLLLLWMITAPVLAAVLPRGRVFLPAAAAVGAGLVALPLAIAGGFLLTQHWVPPGS